MSANARRTVAIALAIIVAYVVAARLGFRLAFAAEQVTTVWAPTGIAQAALLLWGRKFWPAIWLGAFVANAATTAPLWTAVFLATGNTLEAVAAAWILSRFVDFDPAFRRTRDAIAFIVVAGGVTTALSATVGVTTLCVGHVQPWSRFPELWTAWWLGDILGALVVAPVILTTARRSRTRTRRDWAETCGLLLCTAVVTQTIFGQVFGPAIGHPLEYVIFPFLIAAAVRPGQPATALIVLLVSIFTIWNTVRGVGPFASAEVQQSLTLLQVFMGVFAGTGLLLATAITERQTSERRRAAAYAVGQVVAEAATLPDAATRILRAIGETLGWPVGTLWLVEPESDRLRCLTFYSSTLTAGFASATRQAAFLRGVGLPGRVWESGKPTWIENVDRDRNFPRAAAARQAGLHGAFAFPICIRDEVVGVLEFFSTSVLSPDADLLSTMSTVGTQLGQFVARKRVETSVVEGQRYSRAILDTALDAIIGMDHHGLIIEFNPAAERTFGYRRSEVLGRELADLLIPRVLREKHRDGLKRYLATGEGPFIDRRVETAAYHADGHEFPVEVAITRVSEDEPPRFTGFVRDLTARAEAEQEREQLLQRALTARLEAERANRAKDEFLATLSHELRTPLNAIVGWTRMLLDGTMDGRSTRHALEVIDRNANMQAQLIADILDVSRIITGALQMDIKPIDLGSVIGAALDSVRPAAEAKNIRIRPGLEASARLTDGDPQRLQQVVWNLLANAVKFTPPGGLVEVELVDTGQNGLRISVRDNGLGIEPSFLPHVFERFRQADGSVSRQHGGLGLGLAIVRHLVELHGGTVEAHSDGPGKGSSFIVELPRIQAQPGMWIAERPLSLSTNPSGTSRPPSLAGCRALVVDDEDDARSLLATILRAAGADVQMAATSREALMQLSASMPDVLLSDIGMPGEDGYALIREVRKREAQSEQHLPAAAITAYAGSQDRERAIAEGFDCYVAKPIDPTEFVRVVFALYRRANDSAEP